MVDVRSSERDEKHDSEGIAASGEMAEGAAGEETFSGDPCRTPVVGDDGLRRQPDGRSGLCCTTARVAYCTTNSP